MATSAETEAFLREQLGAQIRTRKMFGEYAVYAEGKVVALLCDDALFVKQIPEATAYLGPLPGGPTEGLPYPGARPHWRIDADLWEEADWLAGLIAVLAQALPAPKPRRPRAPKRPH
jgi:hypothetical protein